VLGPAILSMVSLAIPRQKRACRRLIKIAKKSKKIILINLVSLPNN
jgi:hypothetical protein